MAKKKKTKKKAKAKKKAKKKKVKRKKRISVETAVPIREVRADFGGVIRTGSYENKRVSFGLSSGCPRSIKPDIVLQYLESLCANQFYQTQLQALEGMPDEVRDELGDVSRLSPQKAAQKIADFFENFGRKPLTPKQKAKRIGEIQKELKESTLGLKAEDKHLRKTKGVEGKDLSTRSAIVEQIKTLKNELKALRR